MPGSSAEIIAAGEARFGKTPPSAIWLTHGYFDHVGSIVKLLEHWKETPVYAHPLEFPFLTGKTACPEPDATVEGGMLAKISSIYPHEPINIEEALLPLPLDNTVPVIDDWIWLHTPGHVSFYRPSDKILIAGDAFVTVRQESFFKVCFKQKK